MQLHEIEALVRKVPDVTACRLRADPSGDVLAVYVTTGGIRPPADVLADVVTVLAAEARVDVQPEEVHVTPLAATAGATVEPIMAEELELEPLEVEARTRIVAVRTSATEERTSVEVELALGATSAVGHAEARGAGSAPELLATACLDAIEKLCGARVALRLVALRRVPLGAGEVVCVAVQEADGRDERLLVGAAPCDADVARAAAYAALAAMNRRLGRILAGPARQYRIG